MATKRKRDFTHEDYNFFVTNLDSLDPRWKEDKALVSQAKELLKRACLPLELLGGSHEQPGLGQSDDDNDDEHPEPCMDASNEPESTESAPKPAREVDRPIPKSTSAPAPAPARLIPTRLSMQLLATELGLGELTQGNIEDIGEVASEVYNKLRIKVSPKRFKCLCMGCSIPNCAQSERDVLLMAVKRVMLQ